MRIVLDTNPLVSALKTQDGPAASILRLVAQDRADLFVSGDILEQYHRVCARPKLDLPAQAVRSVLEAIAEKSVMVEPSRRLSISPHMNPTTVS
jgi:putative PIN family toxin of toxin-antitoxin system